MRLTLLTAPAIILALLLTTPPAAAQVIRGTVLEAGTRKPIIAAEVVLHTPAGELQTRALVVTDTLGTFRLTAPAPGRYALQVRRLGYATHTTAEFEVEKDEVLVLEITLSTEYLKLDALEVVGRRRQDNSPIGRFRERAEWVQKTGMGKIYTEDDLKRYITLRYLYQQYQSGRGCGPMQILVNKLPIVDLEQLDFLADPKYVEGVEIYRSREEIPNEFAHLRTCSLMLVWTKQATGNPFSLKSILTAAGLTLAVFLFYF